ncbi:ATP-dependent helicase, partial [Actinospica acidiphila]|nr:ATP-dependent helicase [Actinospica acidiphila]
MDEATVTAEGVVTADGLVAPSLPAVFLPAPLPRDGRIAFYDPEGADMPPEAGDARRTDLTVVRPHGASVRRRTVPALTLPVDEALPLLVRARHDPAAHPATVCWGAAALHALRLTARGRLLPGLT